MTLIPPPRAEHTLGKQAGPVLRLFSLSLTNMPPSNDSNVYFHFCTPRLKRPISLKGFSDTISEMVFQKKKKYSLDCMTYKMHLASWQINMRADIHGSRSLVFASYSCFSGTFSVPPNSEQSSLPRNRF